MEVLYTDQCQPRRRVTYYIHVEVWRRGSSSLSRHSQRGRRRRGGLRSGRDGSGSDLSGCRRRGQQRRGCVTRGDEGKKDSSRESHVEISRIDKGVVLKKPSPTTGLSSGRETVPDNNQYYLLAHRVPKRRKYR